MAKPHLLVWTALALSSLAGCAGPHIYQNTSWGMNEKALVAARPESVPAGDSLRQEHATINDLKATVTYHLTAKGLQEVSVVFDPVAATKEQYIDSFHQVKALLTDKYGAPEAQATDLAVKSQRYRLTKTPDYQDKSFFRTPNALIELSCAGACDGTVGNGIMISYQLPRLPTEGL